MQFEHEIRGKLENYAELESLIKQVSLIAKLQLHRYRFSVILTNGNKKGIDLQIRVQNGKPEIMLKIGRHTSTKREEYKVNIDDADFVPAVILFYKLGFTKGVVADCQDWIYKTIDDIEIKLSMCDEKIFNWEIENLQTKKNIGKITALATKLNLKPLNENELGIYWKWMKRYANRKLEIKILANWYQSYVEKSRI